MRFYFVMSRPGSDLDGEEAVIQPVAGLSLAEQVAIRERALGVRLTRVGTREYSGAPFVAELPVEELPFWAKDYLETDAAKAAAKKPRKAPAAPRSRTRSLYDEDGVDGPFERGMAAPERRR